MSAPAVSAAPQTNGVPPSSATQSAPSTQQATQSSQSQPPSTNTTAPSAGSQSQSQQQQQQQQQQPQQQQQQQSTSQPPPPQQPPSHPSHSTSTNPNNAASPRPRDARTLELLLTAQGVTSFEQRVPLLLLDFAYRHTASILSDALHLAADPYVSHAGSRPSAASGAAPVTVGDAAVTASAVQLAIASRLGYQFRGGGGSVAGGMAGGGGAGGGAASKEWLMELARERNKIALPRVQPSEWGVRLPGERFVLSGVSWGLRDVWAGQEGAEDSSSEEEEEDEEEGGDKMALDGPGGGDAMDTEDIGGDGVEGGTMEDVFGDEGLEDEEMAEA
ncbi:hypothetical protein VTJ83DRAFT_2228 [Remersonia thermophila]|uniref:Transcription initiation factor TFIID subunit 9 n=1 Tax=Remersonia thermophila TaxID=72144 RepID=A0ABR4DKG3_9PEZI